MSGNERPETRAFKELEALVRHLGEELAIFRRRAIAAEAELKDGPAPKGRAASHSARGGTAGSELEAENETLKARLSRAEERVRQMMDRVRFLRQQLQSQTTGAGRS
jgi:hypothetical protein